MKKFNKVYNISKFSQNEHLDKFSLHRLLKGVIIVAQCFSLLPVDGITKDINNLKFSWTSFKTIYSVVAIILLALYTIVITIFCIKHSENFFSYVVLVWNIRGLAGMIIFLRLGQKWPQLIQRWSKIETSMLSYGSLSGMKLRFRYMPIVFLLIGGSEHLMFICGGVKRTLTEIKQNESFVKNYFLNLYGEFFTVFDYALWKALIVEFLALVTTFLWQFCDLLIVLLSSALAERLKQISKKMNSEQELNEAQWREIRHHYNNISLLCKTLNETISEMVVLSYFGNVYFISITVFECFSPRPPFETVYFWMGVLAIMFNFISVNSYAAWVYEESVAPISDVLSVSPKHMSHEVDRILHQIAAGDIAIYGGGLFKITKRLILSVTNSIVTVQLILVQFHANIAPNIQ